MKLIKLMKKAALGIFGVGAVRTGGHDAGPAQCQTGKTEEAETLNGAKAPAIS